MNNGTEDLTFIRDWVRKTKSAPALPGKRPASSPPPRKAALEPIAITGVGGFFPGCADVAAFWRKLDRDESLITRVPPDRAPDVQGWWGGFLPDIASFDPGAFDILPMEAEEMDPRQRLLLMSTWRALEDAALDPRSLRKSKTGVFIAGEGNEYAVLMSRAGHMPKMGFGQANSMLANRISYQFDFAGPSEMVDATCAGFAVALHRAVVTLRAGLIDRAIVGAANVILLPDPFVFLTEAGQLSARPTVKSFGRDGDGFLRAEGVGTIVIERSRDARLGGRAVYAEIKHATVNFNGQGGVSMASPNTEAHAELIKSCYREAGIDPRDLSYVEAQGMGSPVADIAEWTALNRALKDLCAERGVSAEPGFCRVSTLKPMLGHMHSASSLGALLKVIRSFQTGKIHRVLDFTEANEYCDMQGTPCRIATQTEDWKPAGKRRLAAIHAYGSGGNNAHVLLEEAESPRKEEPRGHEFEKRSYWFRSELPSRESGGKATEVLQFIRETLAPDGSAFDRETPLTELGLDSLSIAAFVTKLETGFGVSLRRSDVFSHPTPARLAGYVESLTKARPTPVPRIDRPRAAEAGEGIAIIGISLQVAGAGNPEEYWRLLREGRSAIAEIPADRWESGDAPSKNFRGGFLAEVDTFDPQFFRISPKESVNMDPRHRKLLQAAWSAIEDAGHDPEGWKGAEHGIFVGIEESDYPCNEESSITAVHAGTAPARIGYFLDTKGPVLAIGTACSSSLVALHYACRSILEGESDCALAGGCSIISQPARSFQALSQMGEMLSPDGTCYAFDGRANGMVLGEGVGMVLLKRLSHARRDGDPIYAVIKGSGINSDGRTNGLTAPSGERQRELYERVYRQSTVAPAQITYVVAHGTGTSLGDPVEGNALIDAFGASATEPWCALTSPKTNIGHTQAASGIVNLITAALALRKGEIPPSLNFEAANADIPLGASPFYVNTALKSWDAPERHAAVSSFGHTGTNAHVVLGAEPEEVEAAEERPAIIVLSAPSEEGLKRVAKNLLAATVSDLSGLAYTLQVGRAAMDERLGLVVWSMEELREKLGGFVAGRTVPGLHRGQRRRDDSMQALFAEDAEIRKSIDDWMTKVEPAEVLKLWVNGLAVDWSRFYREKKPRRLHLPTYPFEKERYWLKVDPASKSVAEKLTPVMTFREDWVVSEPVTPTTTPGQVLVCFLGGFDSELAWEEELRRVAPEVRWIFVSERAEGGFEKAFREQASIEALICLSAAGAIGDPSVVLPLFQALEKARLVPGRIFLACPFENDLERCFVDAWVAFERSLSPVFSQTKVAVVGWRQEKAAEALWAELRGREPQSALYENGRRHVLRIAPIDLAPAEPAFKRGGTYLIAGGGGELGFPLAEHLAKTYAANLILVGRSGLDEERRARLEALQEWGGEIVYVPVDICDAAALTGALVETRKRTGPIDGVVHAAGLAGSESILEKNAEAFRDVLRPKIEGTMILDEVLRDEPLDFVAYFSSSAAILGDFGACDYAIANRFQTAYAAYRNGLGQRGERAGKTTVINWPVWNTGGLEERTRFYLQTSGQRALEIGEGLTLFEALLGQPAAQQLVLAGDPERVRRFWETDSAPAGMEIEEAVRWDLRGMISDLLKIDRQKLKLETNLADFGFDSISLADFAARLSAHYDVPFTPALFFGHSTIERLTRYFLTEHRPRLEKFYARAAAPVEAERPRRIVKTAAGEPIAIIGRSGRFPQARDIDEMWQILAEGRNAVEKIPSERFDYPGWMGCLPGVAEFDPLFFEISPREAETMDPRQRHLLQESWKALEDAGYGPRQLARERVGVFVGVEEGDYAMLAPTSDLGANHGAILASRLAYFLDFRGPVLAINTACSSALVAVHQACSSLRNGECDAALVAGVSLQLTAAGHIAMGQAGMLSVDGKCSVFDQRANGMVPGEAAVALVLKRLSRAEADGDPIHGVIRASGVNYDGKTNGITAPSGVAQTELLQSVYAAAELDPGAIEYVVAHGTGTKLGDPVEVNALHGAFKDATNRRGWCALTSTKSNFGHTFAASGLVSAVGLLEAFRHEEIPPSLHCETDNDYIVWKDSPFYVNKARKAWLKRLDQKRMGAVSAFGMSGTNAHVVIEEYKPQKELRSSKPGYLLVLSARTEEALRDCIDLLSNALRKEKVRAAGLESISYTLLEGRHHFSFRAAMVVRDLEDAILSLDKWKAGEIGGNVRRGRAPEEPVVEDGPVPQSLPALAELYCRGGVVSWPSPPGENPPTRISLPTYPFARETYWAQRNAEIVKGLHPLVHANTSDFGEQRFTSTFRGDEFFLAHHRVRNERVLPAVGYLEMARAACALAVPAVEQEGAWQLTDVVWLRPLVVSDSPREVRMGLREDGDHVEFEMSVEPEIHAQGKVRFVQAKTPDALDLEALRSRMSQGRLDPEACYAGFRAAGVNYGPAFQGLREVLLGEGEVLARIALPDSVRGAAGSYVLHPSLMDSAFQATIGISSVEGSAARIPFAMEQLRVLDAVPEEAWVWARRSARRIAKAGAAMFDLDIADRTGRVVVELRGLSTLDGSATTVRQTLTGGEFFLRDHGSILPAVVSLEWAREAGSKALGRAICGLKNVVWNQPLTFDGTPREVQTTMEGDTYRVSAGGIVHAQGTILGDENQRPEALAIAEIRSRCAQALPEQEFEPLIEAELGPSMRSLTEFHYQDHEAFALLERPTSEDGEWPPSLLNGALQACTMLARLENPGAPPPTPFSLEELRIYGPIPAEACVHVRKRAGAACRFDLDLAAPSGEVAVSIRGYTGVSPRAGADTLFAVPCWKAAAFAPDSCDQANPIFFLTEASAGIREPLERRWPEARFEALSGASVEADFLHVFELIQQGLRDESVRPIWFLAESRSPLSDAYAALFRTARIEQPRFRAKVILGATVDLVEKELGQSLEDIEVRLNDADEREVRSIREAALAPASGKAAGRAVIWITGGLGGLGRAFARHYALTEKAIVFVSGRSPLDEEKSAFLRELQARDAAIRYLQGDVARVEEVEGMLAAIQETGARLSGIIHAAGVIEDAYILDKSREAVERVWRPKVAGALALDAATRHLGLDFLALFSSLSGAFGNAGQADYAGANAFMDGFAEERNRLVAAGRRQGRTISIAWPLWREGGMGMDPQSEILLRDRSGLISMETAQGIAAFQQALKSGHSHLLVLHGDAAKIRAKIFSAEEKKEAPIETSLPELSRMQAELRRMVSEQQKIAPEKLDLDVELPRYGFDSIQLTELANRLNRRFLLDLMPTLFFEYTTLRAIAGHLIEKYSGAVLAKLADSSETVVAQRRPSFRRREEPPIAIVGISGRFPGSENIEAFWRHLEANHDLITEVPADRWNWREISGDPSENPGKTNVKCAGFLDGIDRFDPAFFGISPREAISMDPQLRLLLETVWATIEDAGYRAGDLSGTKTGVFVGVSTSDYKEAWLRKAAQEDGMDGPALMSHFVIANRISYALNLQGPSEPIDTACSSSLIAIHRAIEAIRQGNCEQAIVGGVNVICAPDITIAASRAGMLSEDGRCKTFDQGADGYGRGEGVAALLLKPLDAARRDGDQIYALVRGSAENHGGRAQSPTAPNPAAQRDLLVSAYGRADIDPRSVGYIEVHGTGTALGDPIEIDGLRAAFEALYEKAGTVVERPHCGLGSVKTNVGHLEAAAGLAGVLKVVMMLRHKKIPGNVHLREPNPYLRLEGTPFYLARQTQDWMAPTGQPRRAGVSSFGIGGSNAHVILEEFSPEPAPADFSGSQAIILSARNEERLRALAKDLRTFVEEGTASLAELAYVLQVGREPMEERLGFMAASREEISARLTGFLDGRLEGLHRGRVSREGRRGAEPTGLLEQWIQGVEIDWRSRWAGTGIRRTSLPTYPFARNRFWFENQTEAAPVIVEKPVVKPPPPSRNRQKESVETFLAESLAKILYLEEGSIERESSFIDIGLDSVLAVEWIQLIKQNYGIKLPATKVYDYPTVSALADFLAESLGSTAEPTPETSPTALTLEEILAQVGQGRLTVEEAERLIDQSENAES